MVVVSDTSILSNFFQIGQLDLLRLVFHQVVLPPKVAQELKLLSNFGHQTAWIENTSWLVIQPILRPSATLPLLSFIDEGEAEAIVLAKELSANFILIDDLQGRELAKKQGLTVIGSVGLLLRAKKLGYIAAVQPLMDDLIKTANTFISPQLYADVLKLASE